MGNIAHTLLLDDAQRRDEYLAIQGKPRSNVADLEEFLADPDGWVDAQRQEQQAVSSSHAKVVEMAAWIDRVNREMGDD